MLTLKYPLIICIYLLFIFSNLHSADRFDEFRQSVKAGDNETAAVILHEIVKSDMYSAQLWREAADICLEESKVSQALVFYKASLNLEKNNAMQDRLKKKIESIKSNCCTGFKLDYVVTFANISVKLLKNLLNLPSPDKLEPTQSGARELPGLVVSSEKELSRLEKKTGISPGNSDDVAYIDTAGKSKKPKSKAKNKSIAIDNTVPVEKMPSYNQAELMKNIVYPEDAIIKMKQGKVIVKVYISSEGKPIKPEIKSSTNKIFNKAAMDAVLKTNFEPAKQNGQPVGCWMFINIDFVLKGK